MALTPVAQAHRLPLRQWLFLGVAIIGFYAVSFSLGALSDDYGVLTALHPFDPWAPFPAGSGQYFRPLTMFSFWLVEQSGSSHWGQHLLNVLIHTGSALLIVRIGLRLADPFWAVFSACFFAFHSAQVTDVVWICARGDLLCGFFLLALIERVVTGKKMHGPLVLTCLALAACASKENGVLAWLVMGLWFWHRQRTLRSWTLWLPALATLAWVAMLWLTMYRQVAPSVMDPLGKAVLLLKWVILMVSPFSPQTLSAYGWWIVAFAGVGLVAARSRLKAMGWRFERYDLWLMFAGPLAMSSMTLVFLGDVAPRLLYASLAALAPAMAVWCGRNPSPQLKIVAVLVWVLFPINAAWQLWDWSQAAQMEQSAGREYLTLKQQLNGKQPYLISWPGEWNGVPVFANDIRFALHHVETGSYGQNPEIRCVLLLRGDLLGARVEFEKISERSYLCRVEGGQGSFHFGANPVLGGVMRWQEWSAEISELNDSGDVIGCRLTFDPSFDDTPWVPVIWSAGAWQIDAW